MAQGQFLKIPDFISDTLLITFRTDSVVDDTNPIIKQVIDERSLPGNVLTIQQTEKWRVIPVDQFVAISPSLSAVMAHQFQQDSLQFTGELRLGQMYLWNDQNPMFNKGRKINAITTLMDTSGKPIGDWCWEITIKKRKKETDAEVIKNLVEKWCREQSQAIRSADYNPNLYPYLYKRQLLTWMNIVYFRDGYALDAHFTLDYPPARSKKWIRGSKGLFYRKAAHHESLGFSSGNQIWYKRFNNQFIGWISTSLHIGGNNFDPDYYSHLGLENILFVDVDALAAVEYHPLFYKGLYAGLGVFQSGILLPRVGPRAETGFSFTVGLALP